MSRRLLSAVARYLPIQYNGTTLAISKAAVGIVPAAVSGTPAQHGLYQGNVVKGWLKMSGDGTTIRGSFNVTSVADTGTGIITITWDRDFLNTNYVVVATLESPDANQRFAMISNTAPPAVGTTAITSRDTANLVDPTEYHVLAIGDQ